MTTMDNIKVNCCVCDTESIHISVGSTNAFGYPDLDSRPSEMERSTIYYLIQRCPSCGYCASDLSACLDNSEALVKSKIYQDILDTPSIPKGAASYLASSYIYEQLREYSESAWMAINASWICDDENDAHAAKKCRERAIEMIEIGQAMLLFQHLSEQTGASEAITIDLMRRVSRFQDARNLAEQTKEKEIDDVILKIINYEETLIDNQDIDSHTIDESLKTKGSIW
jgi:hypothetical protein